MFSLRSLLAPRRSLRLFVLLDETGLCRAFHQSAQTPLGADWIEVCEHRLAWLHQPLPASARVDRVSPPTTLGKALAA